MVDTEVDKIVSFFDMANAGDRVRVAYTICKYLIIIDFFFLNTLM